MNEPHTGPKRLQCIMTGASGYVGSRLKHCLEAQGCSVCSLGRGRCGESSQESIAYSLGDIPPEAVFQGMEALIHCAYDLKLVRWTDIQKTNVEGSLRLFEAAKRAGVKRLIFISSISAFEGCRSLYGKAKLLVEKRVLELGGCVVRPGLVYGVRAEGMFGALRSLVQRLSVIPLIAPRQPLYLCDENDLARLVYELASGALPLPAEPLPAASPEPRSFGCILEILAAERSRRPIFLPFPWQLAWCALKAAEAVGFKTGFKSDSLISLLNPNIQPDFAYQRTIDFAFQPFSAGRVKVTEAG